MQTIKLNTKQAKPIVSRTFPNYRGRKFQIEFTPTVTFSDTNWSGGSRREYKALSADGHMVPMPDYAPWDQRNWEGWTVELPADVLVVEHVFFCGEDLGIRIYVHPCHLPKWLPAGSSTTQHATKSDPEERFEREADDDETLAIGQNYNWYAANGEW